MDIKEITQITKDARERIRREDAQRAEQANRQAQQEREQFEAEVAKQLALVERKVTEAARQGKTQIVYEHVARIGMDRNSEEKVTEIKADASKVITSVMQSLTEDGFSVRRGESKDERDNRDNVGTPPEYSTTPLTISWPE